AVDDGALHGRREAVRTGPAVHGSRDGRGVEVEVLALAERAAVGRDGRRWRDADGDGAGPGRRRPGMRGDEPGAGAREGEREARERGDAAGGGDGRRATECRSGGSRSRHEGGRNAARLAGDEVAAVVVDADRGRTADRSSRPYAGVRVHAQVETAR